MKKKIFFMALAAIALMSLVSCDEDTYIQNDPIAMGYRFVSPTHIILYDRHMIEVEQRDIDVEIKLQVDRDLFESKNSELKPADGEEMMHLYNGMISNTKTADGSMEDVFYYDGFENYMRIYGLHIEVEGTNGKETLIPFNAIYMKAKIDFLREDDIRKEYAINYTLVAMSDGFDKEEIVLAEAVQKVFILTDKFFESED